MNVVDSSGWLEYLAGGPNADFFAPAIEAHKTLIVPTISLFEVFKRVLLQRGEGDALQAVALMQQGQIVELTGTLALAAAHLSADLKLPDGRQHHAVDGSGARGDPLDPGRRFRRARRRAVRAAIETLTRPGAPTTACRFPGGASDYPLNARA